MPKKGQWEDIKETEWHEYNMNGHPPFKVVLDGQGQLHVRKWRHVQCRNRAKCKDKQCPFNHDESTVEKQLGRGGSRKRCEEFIFHYKLWQLTQSDVQRAVTSVDDVVTVKKSDGSTHSPFTDWQEGPAILQARTRGANRARQCRYLAKFC